MYGLDTGAQQGEGKPEAAPTPTPSPCFTGSVTARVKSELVGTPYTPEPAGGGSLLRLSEACETHVRTNEPKCGAHGTPNLICD